jgi:hypothetical protein
VIPVLLKHGADPNAQLDWWEPAGPTNFKLFRVPILYALAANDVSEAIRALVGHGADPARPGTDGRKPAAVAKGESIKIFKAMAAKSPLPSQ